MTPPPIFCSATSVGCDSRRSGTPPAWRATLRVPIKPEWASPQVTLTATGCIDLAVTNFYGESTTFYRNLGGGDFTDATASVGLAVASRRLLGFGVAFFDADNDGRLDLASANGHVSDLRPNYPYQMPAQLLVGEKRGHLMDVSDRAGASLARPADGPSPRRRRSRQ